MSIIKKVLFNIVVLTSAIAGELDDNAYRQCYVAGRRSIDDRISDIYQWMITTKNLRSNDWFLSGFSTINYSQKERTDEIDIEGLTTLLTRMCGTVLAAATAAGIPVIINEVIQGAVSFFDDVQKGDIVLTKTGRKEIAKQFHIFKSPNYRYAAAYFL